MSESKDIAKTSSPSVPQAQSSALWTKGNRTDKNLRELFMFVFHFFPFP